MEKYQTPLIDEWPKISFEVFEGIEIKNPVGNVCYKSFFAFFKAPEIAFKAFSSLLSEEVV